MDPNAVDLSVGKYDVALSTGSSYSTLRVEAAQAMMEAIQVWPNLMQVAGDLVAKAQNWPGADKLSERLRKTIPTEFLSEEEQAALGNPGMTPQQMQEAQMQMQMLQEENKQLKIDKSLQIEDLRIKTYNAETLRIRALSDHEVDGNAMEMQAIQTIINSSKTLDDQEIRLQELDSKYTPKPAGPTEASPAPPLAPLQG
jgi:hypothetical protein